MRKFFIIIGTRPEAIKMLPLAIELRCSGRFQTLICHSGQHREMADSVFDFFNVRPDFRFETARKNQGLTSLTTELLTSFETLFLCEKPDLILTHGDTTTALCAGLAGYYCGIKIAHIEAGLRTYNSHSPYPEEFNRVAIDALSDYHFAPTNLALEMLKREGREGAHLVGNTVIDALKYTISPKYNSPLLENLNGRKLVLITTHRRENWGGKMLSSLVAIREILVENEGLFAILPMHLNRGVREVILSVFEGVKNIELCEPLPLYDFHNLLSRSYCVFSDSGGVQEEASALGIPTFLLRDTSERQEAILSGNVRLVGADKERIKKEFYTIFENKIEYEKMSKKSTVFGDGYASVKIRKILEKEILKNS